MTISKRTLYLLAVLGLMIISLGAVTQVNLTNQVVGLLPIANGGTNTATAAANAVFIGPASGSAAAPSFRLPSPWEFGAVPNSAIGRIMFEFSTGTGISDYGDVTAGAGTVTHALATSTLPSYTQTATSTTNNNVGGLSGNLNYVAGRGLRYFGYGSQSSLGAQRVWHGLTDQTIATMGASDNPAGNYAAVHYCNDGANAGCAVDNTDWFLCTKDNTTINCADSTVAADTSFHTFLIVENIGASFDLYIDGTLRANSALHLPTSTTPMRYVDAVTCMTCTPTAQNLRIARQEILVTASPY